MHKIGVECSNGHKSDPSDWGKPCPWCLLEKVEVLEKIIDGILSRHRCEQFMTPIGNEWRCVICNKLGFDFPGYERLPDVEKNGEEDLIG